VPAGHYTLQTGAFSTMANAEKQKNFFDDLGYTVDITNKIRGGRSLYLVWVGSYRTAEEARAAGREMKAKTKIDAISVERY
jgi:cell division protein FtsN